MMLVDLGRNDIGRVCDYGTVRVPTFMALERYSHVMHMVSVVEGQLAEGAIGSMRWSRVSRPARCPGAPKVRAMQIINELEPTRRGCAGAVGYLDFAGNLDFCIAIRSILLEGGKAYIQSGGGIVADSNPTAEFEETRDKARAMIRALELAQAGCSTMVLVIDNYDSFTYNLVQYSASWARRSWCAATTRRRSISCARLVHAGGDLAGARAARTGGRVAGRDQGVRPRMPLLGVCLGHQAIGLAFGGDVVRAPLPIHGKTSTVEHNGKGCSRDWPDRSKPAAITRWSCDEKTLPADLEVTARSEDGLVMGLRHRTLPIHGVQFHPESVLTNEGRRILRNFLEM